MLASRIFSSVASASPGEAPLLAGEARRGEDRSYVYTCGLLHWFANVTTFCRESAGAPRQVCPILAAGRPRKVVNSLLTSFLGGGCATRHRRPVAHQADGRAARNAQTGEIAVEIPAVLHAHQPHAPLFQPLSAPEPAPKLSNYECEISRINCAVQIRGYPICRGSSSFNAAPRLSSMRASINV